MDQAEAIRYRPYFGSPGRLLLVCWITDGKRQKPVFGKTKPELENRIRRAKEGVS